MAVGDNYPTHTPEKMNITGRVWIDRPSNKYNCNYIYDGDGEDIKSTDNVSVKVQLFNSSGNQVGSDATVDSKNSTYTFSNINVERLSDLSGYYIKFIYDEKKYRPVSPLDDEMEGNNRKNSSKAYIENNEGEAYIRDLSRYTEFYSGNTLSEMNLGIKLIENTRSVKIEEEISQVKVIMNESVYTYTYGNDGDTTNTNVPTVQWEGSLGYYERHIYPSDIIKGTKDGSLKVFVVYKITITNPETENYGANKNLYNPPPKRKNSKEPPQYEYVEEDYEVTKLFNEYDNERYILNYENYNKKDNNRCKYDEYFDNNQVQDFYDWETGQSNQTTYNGGKIKSGLKSNESRDIYIRFQVNDVALKALLEQSNSFEKIPTTAIVKGHHNYWYTKEVETEETYFGKNGTVRKWVRYVCSEDGTADATDTDSAYYLKLFVENDRTIKGIVFEDNKDNNMCGNTGQVLGNGRWENGENKIKDVTVELIDADTNNMAYVYPKDSDSDGDGERASTTSDADGNYEFIGVVPGTYYVRFTYGDGTQRIQDSENVTIADYKSTIVSETCVTDAMKKKMQEKEYDLQWYNHKNNNCGSGDETAINNSNTATDDLEERANYNERTRAEREATNKNMYAYTPDMRVTIENNIENDFKVAGEDIGTRDTIAGINFGIIKIPDISLRYDKVISNVQITNAQGNVIANGNPKNQNLKVNYVSDLDDRDDNKHLVTGSQYIKAEINEQELYGSTLRLTYTIVVENNSEVDYYELGGKNDSHYGYYYVFGDNDNATEASIDIEKILDYLDPNIEFESHNDNYKYEYQPIEDSSPYENKVNNIKASTELNYNNILVLTKEKNDPIYSIKSNDGTGVPKNTRVVAEYTAKRLLDVEDDLGISNVSEVIELEMENNPSLIETIDSSERYFDVANYENPTAEVYATVTPPTGLDKFMPVIYIISGVIALAVISGGIILIKKKVLHK